MKKSACLSLLLAALVLFESAALPVRAAETTEATTPPTEITEQTFPPVQEQSAPATDDLAFGTVGIYNGCRGLNGMVPLYNEGQKLQTAQGVVVFERNTETMVYSFNPDLKLAPGTLSKLVTALVVVESVPLDAIVTCSSRNISKLPGGSQNVKLKEGEQLTVNDLLHCLILHGANDAAVALAEYVSGNQEAFVTLMNERVKRIGCTNTQFGNIHGLDNVQQHTTARDMAKIMVEATKNETIQDLLFTRSYTVPETNRSEARKLQCQNYLISESVTPKFYQTRVTGGLASYSDKAGASIVCTAEEKGMDLVCVILGAHRTFQENGWNADYYGNFDEMVELLDFIFGGYRVKRVVYEGQAMNQFSVLDGENQVVGQPLVNIDTVLPNGVGMDNLKIEPTPVKGGITAPIKRGEMIATAQVWYRNSCIAEAELFAMSDVRYKKGGNDPGQGGQTRNDKDTSGFLGFVKIVSAVVLIPIALYLVINTIRRARAKARHRRRRSGRRRSR